MTDAADEYSEGPCSSCGEPDQLRRGGLAGQPICPTCTFWHERAPEVLADLKKRRQGVVIVEGKKIRLRSKGAALLLAKQMAAKWRREQAEKAALASSAEGA